MMKQGLHIEPNGGKYWYKDDKLHREDGPAAEWDGYKAWYVRGQRNRDDGPAIEWVDGYKAWWKGENFIVKEVLLGNGQMEIKHGILMIKN